MWGTYAKWIREPPRDTFQNFFFASNIYPFVSRMIFFLILTFRLPGESRKQGYALSHGTGLPTPRGSAGYSAGGWVAGGGGDGGDFYGRHKA